MDLNAEVTELVLPDGTIAYTHIGMLRAAKNVKNELDELGILRQALNTFPEYTLVTVGHRFDIHISNLTISLGGGVAAILAHLLKADPYPVRSFEAREAPVKCFAYSPPGCIISRSGKEYFETFCTSIVIGTDVIPSLLLFD